MPGIVASMVKKYAPVIEIRAIKMQSNDWEMIKEKTHKLMHRPIFFYSIISYKKYFFVDRYA